MSAYCDLNTFKTSKSEATGQRIFDAALDLFREGGYDSSTMRGIAQKAGVATGAAYYYYESKDAIIMEFYRRAYEEMQPAIEGAVLGARGLEQRLQRLIQAKLDHFAPNRAVLRALLRTGADPKSPVSPFSEQTREIRESDIDWFRRVLDETKVPRDLEPELPRVLWFFQMGIILFWVIDESERQEKTWRLLSLSCRIVANLVRLSSLPLMRPVRKTALELIAIIA